MDKIKGILSRSGHAIENELGQEHANHDLNEKAAEIVSQQTVNDDFEADRKVPDLDLVVSKSQEFDPITSRLVDEIIDDDYAGIHVEDDSPYPEVRAAVPSSDDYDMPQATIRGWTIGLIMTTIGSAMNMYFSLHSPTVTITTLVTSILAYPIGRFWAWCVPKNWKIFGLPLNPGPFNIKEHAVITIMANASFSSGPAYATDILVSMNKFYNIDFGVGFALVATLATNMIGFSMGGLIRRAVVDSPSAIWPQNLVTSTFLTNMHINENHPANGWKISRLAFFLTVFIVGFFYYWFPGYIFTALSYFSWITWIKPNNVTINQIFGSSSGLGMFPNSFSLD
ncbi:hypothetical protein CANMA_003954, partial [Candida margitis]|uniref:uncharacterized protein n=1 Tax=Candida margitis TaxID=1775924 RepID=UPI002227065E